MVQAFKLIVSDPGSILDSLTREVKEIGADGQEVISVLIRSLGHLSPIVDTGSHHFAGD